MLWELEKKMMAERLFERTWESRHKSGDSLYSFHLNILQMSKKFYKDSGKKIRIYVFNYCCKWNIGNQFPKTTSRWCKSLSDRWRSYWWYLPHLNIVAIFASCTKWRNAVGMFPHQPTRKQGKKCWPFINTAKFKNFNAIFYFSNFLWFYFGTFEK